FVTALSSDDRCHLNGLAMVDSKPRYVTCLGETDTAGGGRANKANGGRLLDVPSGQCLAPGPSLPHSPRWVAHKLWVLGSGQGSIAVIDRQTGKWQEVARLPGFTRGLDFYGPFAFIGLSQVRETAIFSDIPITERQKERICGVWVVDLRNGQTVAFLQFEEAVQEIFAVQVLHAVRYPEIASEDEDLLANSFVLPEEAMKDVARPEPSACVLRESRRPVSERSRGAASPSG